MKDTFWLFTNIDHAYTHHNGGKMNLCCQSILIEEIQDAFKHPSGLGNIRGFRSSITQNVFAFVVNCRPDQYEVRNLSSCEKVYGVRGSRESSITFKDGTQIIVCHADLNKDLDITAYRDIGTAAEQLADKVRTYSHYQHALRSKTGAG